MGSDEDAKAAAAKITVTRAYIAKLMVLMFSLCCILMLGIYELTISAAQSKDVAPEHLRAAVDIPFAGGAPQQMVESIHPEQLSSGLPRPEDPLPAEGVRNAVGEPGEPFLGSGKVSTKFFDLSETEAQGLFYAKVSRVTYNCSGDDIFHIKPIAKLVGSAHELCGDNVFSMKQGNCLAYSFGINDEWNFESGLNKSFGCEIHSFDPRSNFSALSPKDYMNVPNLHYHKIGVWGWNFNTGGGWELRDLNTIINMLHHQNRVIDVIKLDIEGAEWPVLRSLVDSGVHKSIKQIALEVHAPRVNFNPLTNKGEVVTVLDLAEMWQTLHDLEAVGFRMYMTRTKSCCETFAILKTNPFLAFGDKPKCCFRVVYVNNKFLPK